MNNAEYLEQWLKWHEQYEKRAYRIFRIALLETISNIPLSNITYENARALIELNINSDKLTHAYIEVYTSIGLIHGNRIGRGINRELKDYEKPLFNRIFQNSIVDWVRENAGSRITSVLDTVAKKIIELVVQASADNLTIEQMQRFIRDRIGRNILSRYEVTRIARTESTTAANHAALISGETSGIVLEKVWISTQNKRTRIKPKDQFDHYHMNGVAVEQNEKFILRSKDGIVDKMDYPGDTSGSAGDIINCRCSVALRPKRDADGFIIRK